MSLGPHGILVTDAGLAWARRSEIVKQLDGTALLEVAPDTAVRVFRQSWPNEMDTTDPTNTVLNCISGLKGYNHRNLYLQLWCGAHPTLTQLKMAVATCHARGYKTVGSSHFTGDYTQADWDDAEAAGVDAHGDQGYWGNQGFTLDHALRYRRFWKPGNKPVMNLECGRDKVEGGRGGYIKDNVAGVVYAGELNDYERETSKNSYFLGSTPFTSGPTNNAPDVDWRPFDTDPISHLLGLGGNVPPTFNVGPGVLALMAKHADAPKSDENYCQNVNGIVFKSETFGAKGIYQWNKSANETVLIPFTAG